MSLSDIRDLGKLDPQIYKCISSSITTNRVVLTSKQLLHMADHHPDEYEQIVEYVSLTIQDPDYILRDKDHVDTGLVIRRIPLAGESLMIVLRVCTNTDPVYNANSVISGWKISPKRLERYLRAREIIYNRQDQC